MPRHDAKHSENNAALIMTYFHPWTLDKETSDEHVPFLGHLCSRKIWHDSMCDWFGCGVLRSATDMYRQLL